MAIGESSVHVQEANGDIYKQHSSRILLCIFYVLSPTASIVSKKAAEGLQALILDVKYGSGAFQRDAEHAADMARMLVSGTYQIYIPECHPVE